MAQAAEAFDYEVEDFGALFEESIKSGGKNEGAVITGIVVGIEKDVVIIDVGLKSEGRVPTREFAVNGVIPEMKAGDQVEVYLEKIENKNGEAVLSREKALREEAWVKLEKACTNAERVEGVGRAAQVQRTSGREVGHQYALFGVQYFGGLAHKTYPRHHQSRGAVLMTKACHVEGVGYVATGFVGQGLELCIGVVVRNQYRILRDQQGSNLGA